MRSLQSRRPSGSAAEPRFPDVRRRFAAVYSFHVEQGSDRATKYQVPFTVIRLAAKQRSSSARPLRGPLDCASAATAISPRATETDVPDGLSRPASRRVRRDWITLGHKGEATRRNAWRVSSAMTIAGGRSAVPCPVETSVSQGAWTRARSGEGRGRAWVRWSLSASGRTRVPMIPLGPVRAAVGPLPPHGRWGGCRGGRCSGAFWRRRTSAIAAHVGGLTSVRSTWNILDGQASPSKSGQIPESQWAELPRASRALGKGPIVSAAEGPAAAPSRLPEAECLAQADARLAGTTLDRQEPCWLGSPLEAIRWAPRARRTPASRSRARRVPSRARGGAWREAAP